MSIWGNTVGGNKPLEAVRNAQKTADAALPKAGGAMAGNITMDGNRVTGLGDPVNDGDAVNKKCMLEYVDGKHMEAFVTLTLNDWDGKAAPYTQTIGVEGILETDNPHVFPVYDTDLDARKAQREAWALVGNGKTTDGAITFTCDEEKPAVAIPLQMEVNR